MDAITMQKHQPIEPRIIELIFRQDPQWYAHCSEGVFYLLLHHKERIKQYYPASLSFRLQCPKEVLPATYIRSYVRWFHSSKEGKSLFEALMKSSATARLRFQRCVYEAQRALAQGITGNKLKKIITSTWPASLVNVTAAQKRQWGRTRSYPDHDIRNVWPLSLVLSQDRVKQSHSNEPRRIIQKTSLGQTVHGYLQVQIDGLKRLNAKVYDEFREKYRANHEYTSLEDIQAPTVLSIQSNSDSLMPETTHPDPYSARSNGQGPHHGSRSSKSPTWVPGQPLFDIVELGKTRKLNSSGLRTQHQSRPRTHIDRPFLLAPPITYADKLPDGQLSLAQLETRSVLVDQGLAVVTARSAASLQQSFDQYRRDVSGILWQQTPIALQLDTRMGFSAEGEKVFSQLCAYDKDYTPENFVAREPLAV